MAEPTDRAPSASPEGAPPFLTTDPGTRIDIGFDGSVTVTDPDGATYSPLPDGYFEDLTEEEEPEPGGATSAWEHHHGL
jgi:hypothetical protein